MTAGMLWSFAETGDVTQLVRLTGPPTFVQHGITSVPSYTTASAGGAVDGFISAGASPHMPEIDYHPAVPGHIARVPVAAGIANGSLVQVGSGGAVVTHSSGVAVARAISASSGGFVHVVWL
jgi:hypothetical protein